MSARQSWERRWIDAVLRHRGAVLAGIAALSVVAGVFASRVRFDSDIEGWFLEGDPNLASYHAFLERFGADEVSVVGVFGDALFTPEALAAVDAFTRAAEKAPNAHRVRSLTNIATVRRLGPGHVGVERLMDALPETPEEAAALRARALADDLVRDNLVSADGRGLAVIVELDPAGNDFAAKVEHVQALRAAAVEHLGPLRDRGLLSFELAGSPPLDEAFFLYTEHDFMVLAPAALLVVVLATFLLFRRWTAVVVPLSVVGLASVWVFGLMGALHIDISLISSSLVALILAVGVADSIHVVSDYHRELMSGTPREEAVAQAVASLLVPCLFTSLTTAAGFLSLLVSDLAPIREFGWLAAVGVGFAFLLSMTFIPCILGLVRAPDAAFVERQLHGRTSRLLGWLGRPTRRSSRWVLAVGLALTALCGWGALRLSTDANPLNYFLPGDPVRVALERVDAQLSGSTSFDFVVTTRDGGMKDPAILARLDRFAKQVESVDGVTRVLSVLDSLRAARSALTDGEETGLPGPTDHPYLAAQLFLFLEGAEDFSTMLQGDYSIARLTARVQMSKAHSVTSARGRIDAWIGEASGTDVRIEATGYVKLMSDMERYLFDSQVASLGVAFLVITLMMFVLLRSPWLGLFSMIPNLLPILAGLAFMAAADVALDPGTIMIGCMALGLVVDDTVHFLVRLRRVLADGATLEDAIARTMRATGRPIIVTSLVLAGGFATLGLGSFRPNVAFGLVSAVVIVVALIADLGLLPAALLVLRPPVERRRTVVAEVAAEVAAPD